jgi:hypothetical protein
MAMPTVTIARVTRNARSPGDSFTSHLLGEHARPQAFRFELQLRFRLGAREEIEQRGDQPGPSRLMARS